MYQGQLSRKGMYPVDVLGTWMMVAGRLINLVEPFLYRVLKGPGVFKGRG